jgi:hypothetical protein
MKHSSKPRKTRKRPLGLFRGQIWMAPDFDAPMKFIQVNGDMLLVPDRSRPIKKRLEGENPPERARHGKKIANQWQKPSSLVANVAQPPLTYSANALYAASSGLLAGLSTRAIFHR